MPPADLPFDVADIDKAPTDLPEPRHVDWQASYHELKARFDQVATRNFQLEEEASRLRAQNGTREILDGLMIPYARRTFFFMCTYCGVVGSMLVASGIDALQFKLADSVLQLLVGSTAVTVIGLVGMVLTGVFVGARSR